jgi:hypothetical protein
MGSARATSEASTVEKSIRRSYDLASLARKETMRQVLGVSVHTGWAVGVLLAAQDRVVGRFHVDMGKAEHGGYVHAYHLAAESKQPQAEIDRVRSFALSGARSAFDAILGDHRVDACAIIAGNVALPPTLDRILASHAALHTAEGELFRDVLATVAGEHGIAVRRIPAKKLRAEADLALGDGEAWAKALGKGLGPPWSKDHRDAALAARLLR